MMKRVRQKGTPAEKTVAEICRSLGLGYRLNVRSLPGSPDLANKTRRWAIFVNGCFWHHHTGCKLATIPTRNAAFWGQKFAANRKRDAAKIRQLRRAGFKTIVVWQCQTRDRRALEARLAALAPSLDGRDKS
jgi:DNA mismatch endonuclease (patch repair protein)